MPNMINSMWRLEETILRCSNPTKTWLGDSIRIVLARVAFQREANAPVRVYLTVTQQYLVNDDGTKQVFEPNSLSTSMALNFETTERALADAAFLKECRRVNVQ